MPSGPSRCSWLCGSMVRASKLLHERCTLGGQVSKKAHAGVKGPSNLRSFPPHGQGARRPTSNSPPKCARVCTKQFCVASKHARNARPIASRVRPELARGSRGRRLAKGRNLPFRETPMASIRISLLGGFAAHSPEGDALKLPTRKAEALVAFLAAGPASRSRATVSRRCSGAIAATGGRHSLSQALSSVRGALDDGSAIFVAEREAVALRPMPPRWTLPGSRPLAPDSALPDLQHAARLYRGRFLDGFNLREPGSKSGSCMSGRGCISWRSPSS